METRITFLGVGAAVPAPGTDTACYLINGSILVDCGWRAAPTMLEYGLDPLAVKTLIFTHCHHDHYLGLPGLLFYWGMRRPKEGKAPTLQIVGPPDDLPLVVDLSRRFLQADRFPVVWPEVELRPLEPGAVFENEAFRLETIRALHPVTGVCSRFTDKATGVVIALSGDTGPNPLLAELARDADLLIHEASIAPDRTDDQLRGDHSRAQDAARTAAEAGVGSLRLVHLSGGHDAASLAAARAIFPATELARQGETIVFSPRP